MSAAIMIVTFVLVLAVPLQYAVLAGATISVLKYIYLSSLDVHVKQVVLDGDGLPRETEAPAALASDAVTVLDIYGSLFWAAGPRIRASLPAVGDAHCPVVVLRLRGRGTLHSATIALFREYGTDCAARGGRMYLAGIGHEMEEQFRRTGLLDQLGPDAVVAATDELYGACATAQQRGESWLEENTEGRTPDPGGRLTRVTACAVPSAQPSPPGLLRNGCSPHQSSRSVTGNSLGGRGGYLRHSPFSFGVRISCCTPSCMRNSTRSGNRDHHGQLAHVAPSMSAPFRALLRPFARSRRDRTASPPISACTHASVPRPRPVAPSRRRPARPTVRQAMAGEEVGRPA